MLGLGSGSRIIIISAFGLMIGPGSAWAQASLDERGDFSVQRFRPAGDHYGILQVEWAAIPRDSIAVSAMTNYSRDPLFVSRESEAGSTPIGALVENRLDVDLAVTWSTHCCLQLTVGGRLTAFQDRGVADEIEVAELQKFGLGDFFVAGKVQILTVQQIGVDVAAQTIVSVAGTHHNYFSENGAVLSSNLLASRSFGPLRAALNLGGAIRSRTPFLDVTVGSEGLYQLGLAYRFTSWPIELGTAISGAYSLHSPFRRGIESPVAAVVGGQVQLGALQLFVGAGGALNDAYGNPTFRGFAGMRFWYDPDAE